MRVARLENLQQRTGQLVHSKPFHKALQGEVMGFHPIQHWIRRIDVNALLMPGLWIYLWMSVRPNNCS